MVAGGAQGCGHTPAIGGQDRLEGHIDGAKYVDRLVMGTEPCSVVSLENYEMAPSVDIYLHKHASLEDLLETAKCALIYGKTLTLQKYHWPQSDVVRKRNRRVAISLAGVTEFVQKHGMEVYKEWVNKCYLYLR